VGWRMKCRITNIHTREVTKSKNREKAEVGIIKEAME
jgi:hypothetical protein